VLDVVLGEIRKAPAIVSLLSPDDYAELRKDLRKEPKDDPAHTQAGYQPRPNVILETGMALALMRDRTIVVTKGRLRELSDVSGLHAVQWDDTPAKRKDLVQRLQKLGLPADTTGSDWLG
jgi:predicted nucleotide-binding protein